MNLPLDRWVYSFLDRLETKGLFVSEDFSTRPYSREAITEMILKIDNRVEEIPDLLSGVESEFSEQLKGDFYEELQKSGQDIAIREREYEPHMFSWRDEDVVAHFDGLVGEQVRLETKEDVDLGIPSATTSFGISARVNIKESMAIFFEGRSFILSDTDSLTNTVFDASLGLPVTKNALVDVAITDNAAAYMVFRLPWFDLTFGRDLVEWGPGVRGNLALSRNSNFYDLLKLTFRYRKVKLEYFHALLNADETKYLVGHRLEIRPSKLLQLAVTESLVYAERNIEPLYLNPFFPFIISERHLGNQDNNMISFDGSLYLPQHRMKFYGELFFDDFSFAKNIFENYVNKWAILAGWYWVNPLGLQNTDFRLEAVRIQPFVYTHRSPRNTYSNYNNTIGHWLGPDSDDWFIELTHHLHRNFQVSISWEQRRRAQNDITEGIPTEDNRT